VVLDWHKIFEIHKRVITCISTALSALGGEKKAVETYPVGTFNLATYNEITDLVEKQNLLINKYIRKSVLAQFDGVLSVCELVTQYGILAEIFKSKEYFAKEPKEEKHEDFTLLLAYLK
jgi:hypothetical protein